MIARYFEINDGEYILQYGRGGYGGSDISEERYNDIIEAVTNMPSATETVSYRLKTDLTYESVAVEPVEDDPTAEELLDILTGVEE